MITDTDRINFLEEGHWDCAFVQRGMASGWHVGAEEAYTEWSGKTLREAIDEGIKEKRK